LTLLGYVRSIKKKKEYTGWLTRDQTFQIFSFMCMFCRSLFVLLYFFFWPLCCLFYFDIRILITPLVSSNSSQRLNDTKGDRWENFLVDNMHENSKYLLPKLQYTCSTSKTRLHFFLCVFVLLQLFRDVA
jgi:hypothetical protein